MRSACLHDGLMPFFYLGASSPNPFFVSRLFKPVFFGRKGLEYCLANDCQETHQAVPPEREKHMNNTNTGALTRGAIIAALYAAVTLLLAPISYGEVQIRISEALTLLPILLPEAVPALTVGCLLANILGGTTIFDIIFGTLATLLAALCTRALRRNQLLASFMPVLFNGVIVGAVVHYCYAPVIPLPLCMAFVAAGEAVSCMLLGPVVLRAAARIPSKMLHS